MKHVLRAISGPQVGKVIVLGKRATLGRAADCEIQILHEGVSRRHTKLLLSDGGVKVTDLSSKSGTYVNGTRATQVMLESGDTLCVLDFNFIYECVPDSDPVTTSPSFKAKVTSGDSLRGTGPVAVVPPVARRKRVPSTPVAKPPARAMAQAPQTPQPASEAYSAGSSGRWRRSVEPAAPPTRAQSDVPSNHTPPMGYPVPRQFAAGRDQASTPVAPSSRRPRPDVAAQVAEPPPSEPAPVTTGSGMFRYPVDPSAAGPAASGARASVSELRRPSAATDAGADRLPAAARGGSAAPVGGPSKPRVAPTGDFPMRRGTAEYAAHPSDSQPRMPLPVADAERGIVKETGEYPAPSVPNQTGEYGSLDDDDPSNGTMEVPVSDEDAIALGQERALEALTAELSRRASASTDIEDGPTTEGGLFALAAVLRYREFRVRVLSGGRLSVTQQRHFDELGRYLLRKLPSSDALVMMRRHTRFSCELPAELTPDHGAPAIAVAMYDISAGGARLDVGGASLQVGDSAWLRLDLTGVTGLPVPGASTVVFESRVVWVEQHELGVVFAGAAKYAG